MKIEFKPRGANAIQKALINIGWQYHTYALYDGTVSTSFNQVKFGDWWFSYGEFYNSKCNKRIKTNKAHYSKAFLDTETKMLVFDDIVAINVGAMV